MKLFEPRGSNEPPREQHYPGRAPIDAYGNGGFRFADMSHRGSILCLPSGIHGWAAGKAADIDLVSLSLALEQADAIDTLLLGTGTDLVPVRPDVRAAFREAGIGIDVMSTGAAIRIFNIMLGENRKVAAALLAVD
jgi:uncharacterized protein